jgi:hypothetical protein
MGKLGPCRAPNILLILTICLDTILTSNTLMAVDFNTPLSISSINCNSLNMSNTGSFNHKLKMYGITKLKTDIILLCDIRLSNSQNVLQSIPAKTTFRTNPYRSYEFYSNSTKNKRGVGILLKKNCNFSVLEEWRDGVDENYLFLKLQQPGSSLAAAVKESMMESRSSKRRKAPHLPAPSAATVQSAREKANSVITNTLNRIAGNRPAESAQQGQENDYKMEVGNSPPPGQRNGAATQVAAAAAAVRRRRIRVGLPSPAKQRRRAITPGIRRQPAPLDRRKTVRSATGVRTRPASLSESTRICGVPPATEIRI